MNSMNIFLVFAITLFLNGCSAFGIDGWLNSRTVAAEERLLLVTDKAPVIKRTASEISLANGGREIVNTEVVTGQRRVVCAEPSPDAMTALAASGSLSGSYLQQVDASAAFAFSQSIGELGERTPVIQMLRDELYRACEANMNGLLSDNEYKEILAYYDIYSMTVLAIEDLTKRPRAPLIIDTSANAKVNAENGQDISAQGQQSEGVGTAGSENSQEAGEKAEVAKEVKNILCNYYELKYQLWLLALRDQKPGNNQKPFVCTPSNPDNQVAATLKQ